MRSGIGYRPDLLQKQSMVRKPKKRYILKKEILIKNDVTEFFL